jgi:hypothetical protein
MGFLQDFGLDEIVPALADLAHEVGEIKNDLLGGLHDDIIEPIQGQVDTVKDALQEGINGVASSLSEGNE